MPRNVLLGAIQSGIKPTITSLPPALTGKIPRETKKSLQFITECLTMGVPRRMTKHVTQETRHFSPMFAQRKADRGKIRMMNNLRQFSPAWEKTPKSKTANWQTVGESLPLIPLLQRRILVELLSFVFHLGLRPSAGTWSRMKTAIGYKQRTALQFVLHASPY